MFINLRKSIVTALGLLFLSGALASEPIRIDGTTDETAKVTYERMIDAASPEQARELRGAMIVIVLDGIESASEMLARPELRNPSIGFIRSRVHARLTGRSSRTPEVPFPGKVVAQFPPIFGLRVGGRLNYGVRPHEMDFCCSASTGRHRVNQSRSKCKRSLRCQSSAQ